MNTEPNEYLPHLCLVEVAPSVTGVGEKETARRYCGTVIEDSVATHGFLRLYQPPTDKWPSRTIFINPSHVRTIELIEEQEFDELLKSWGY